MLLLPKELDATKVLNNALRSDVRLYGHQHLINLRTDVVKLMATSSGLNKLHYENILVEIDKILSKLNKTEA